MLCMCRCVRARSLAYVSKFVGGWVDILVYILFGCMCVCVHVYNVNEIESEGEEKRKMTGIEWN